MGPQLIQIQFGLSASNASFAVGVVSVVAATAGNIFGGSFIAWRNYNGVQTAGFCVVIAMLAVPFTFMFLLGCDEAPVVGFERNVPGDLGLQATCNRDCMRNDHHPDLVCINDVTYFSLCHAGCVGQEYSDQVADPRSMLHHVGANASLSCSCVDGDVITVQAGCCKGKGCNHLIPF